LCATKFQPEDVALKSWIGALAIITVSALSANAQQYARVYSPEQAALVGSSSGVATSYYLPSGKAYTAYGVPTTTFYPPSPPMGYTTFYAPGQRYIYTPAPYGQPRNRLSGYCY
jgi:hypothetical protein